MPRIYRIRYIPFETVDLSSDSLLYRDEHYLITKWLPIKPRNDISSGISCVFLEHGWKISAFLDSQNKIKYWYCDIIEIEYNESTDTYYLNDLLTDIRILPDGRVEVIDLDELAIAFEEGLITDRQLSMSLKRSNELLNMIYGNKMPSFAVDIIRSHTGREMQL